MVLEKRTDDVLNLLSFGSYVGITIHTFESISFQEKFQANFTKYGGKTFLFLHEYCLARVNFDHLILSNMQIRVLAA